jgi:hypothetical protein
MTTQGMDSPSIINRRLALRKVAQLTGALVSVPVATAVLNGCRPSETVNWAPQFFDQESAVAISRIADIILPASKTPSASDVQVPAFVDLIVKDCYHSKEQEDFLNELQKLQSDFKNHYKKPFNQAKEDDQVRYITSLDEQLASPQKPSFFQQLKQLVLLGYFTSEKVMTEHLNYHAIAGRYDGCVPFTAGEGVYVDNNVAG